jgi:hypothetical protein
MDRLLTGVEILGAIVLPVVIVGLARLPQRLAEAVPRRTVNP